MSLRPHSSLWSCYWKGLFAQMDSEKWFKGWCGAPQAQLHEAHFWSKSRVTCLSLALISFSKVILVYIWGIYLTLSDCWEGESRKWCTVQWIQTSWKHNTTKVLLGFLKCTDKRFTLSLKSDDLSQSLTKTQCVSPMRAQQQDTSLCPRSGAPAPNRSVSGCSCQQFTQHSCSGGKVKL